MRGVGLALLAVPLGGALQAQAINNQPPMRHFSEAEVAAVAVPTLAFEETSRDVANYEKYFYFHRPATSFDEAYADIRECDALSESLAAYGGSAATSGALQGMQQQMITQYGLAGGIGGAIGAGVGAAAADAIHGSAERRRVRRLSMRNCMHFKGYSRYGLAKSLWEAFNFEEGNGRKEEAERERVIRIQARVASGSAPQAEKIEA